MHEGHAHQCWMVMFLLTDVVLDGSRVPQSRIVFPLSWPMKSL